MLSFSFFQNICSLYVNTFYHVVRTLGLGLPPNTFTANADEALLQFAGRSRRKHSYFAPQAASRVARAVGTAQPSSETERSKGERQETVGRVQLLLQDAQKKASNKDTGQG